MVDLAKEMDLAMEMAMEKAMVVVVLMQEILREPLMVQWMQAHLRVLLEADYLLASTH